MHIETEQETLPSNDNVIVGKLENIEVILAKQAAERKGNGVAALIALCAAGLYFGSTYMFPNAGKQQRPIAVEFTSMAINQSNLQNSYNEKLHQLLAKFPGSSSAKLEFSSNAADLANNIVLLNGNVTNSVRLALSVSAFLPVILDDFQAQVATHALSSDQINQFGAAVGVLKQTTDKLVACSSSLDAESAAYREGIVNGAAPDVQARVMIRMMATLASHIRGQSDAVKCMQLVDQFTSSFPRLERIHDLGVVEFNKDAEKDTWLLALFRSVAGVILFFVGNPTRAFIQSLWSKYFKKARTQVAR